MNEKHNFKPGDRVFIIKESQDYSGIYAGTDCEVTKVWSEWVDVVGFDGREFSMPPNYIVPYEPITKVCTCGAWTVHGKNCSPAFHYRYCDLSENV